MREVLRNSARVVLDALGWQASLVALDRFLSPGEERFRARLLGMVSEENAKAREFCRSEVAAALEGIAKGSLREWLNVASGNRESIFGRASEAGCFAFPLEPLTQDHLDQRLVRHILRASARLASRRARRGCGKRIHSAV
jgi:hypothetical protein